MPVCKRVEKYAGGLTMSKVKKLIIAAVVILLAVFGFNVFIFLGSTVSGEKISDGLGSNAVYTQIVDGADYGCEYQKYKIETSSYGQSYLTFYHRAPFGFIKSTGRYCKPTDTYLMNDEIDFSFSSMNRYNTKYSYVFYGSNSQQAAAFEITIDNVETVIRELDPSNPFVCVFTDSDFDSDESVVHLKKTVRLLDENGNTLIEQVI